VHRVGRTGRLAATGHAFTFVTRSLARLSPALVNLLETHGQAVDPTLRQLAEAWTEMEQRLTAEQLAELERRQAEREDDEVEAVAEEPLKIRSAAGDGTPAAADPLYDGMAMLGSGSDRAAEDGEPGGDDGARGGGWRRRAGDVLLVPTQRGAKAPMLEPLAASALAPLGGGVDRGAGGGKKRKAETEAAPAVVEFEAALGFDGTRPGAVFKKGALGMGYYRDVGPPRERGGGDARRARGALPGRLRKKLGKMSGRGS